MSSSEVAAKPARDVGRDDFTDLTPVPVKKVEWAEGGHLRVVFERPLSEEEDAAVRRRIVSATAEEEQLRAEAEAFLATPATDTTLEEIRAQLDKLTRLVLGQATGPDDTTTTPTTRRAR